MERLDAEAESDATTVGGVAKVGVAGAADSTEKIAVARNRRTQHGVIRITVAELKPCDIFLTIPLVPMPLTGSGVNIASIQFLLRLYPERVQRLDNTILASVHISCLLNDWCDNIQNLVGNQTCLLYTSDAADEL